MKVGDLVFELPLGRMWFEHNPWMTGAFGIITEVIDHEAVFVLWATGRISTTTINYLEVCNESREHITYISCGC